MAPGEWGEAVAFLAEVGIALVLMLTVLWVGNTPRLARHTGLFAGALVCLYVTFEAPLSGMSMNPARSFASAYISENWSSWWVYHAAPPLGMLLAAEAYVRLRGAGRVKCAKLHHDNPYRCIFCGKRAARAGIRVTGPETAHPSPRPEQITLPERGRECPAPPSST